MPGETFGTEQGAYRGHHHSAHEGRHHSHDAHRGERNREHGSHRGGHRGHGRKAGHGGHHGHHGGRGRRLERGALRVVLLDLLRESPKHGYELIRCFEERTHGQYAPSPGVLYPTLQLLEDQGLVTSEAEAGRRVYLLTETGQAELDRHAEQVASFWSHFASDAPSAGSRHEAGFLQDALDDLARTVWTRLRDAVASDDAGTIRLVREAVERCENEVRAIIAADPGAAAPAPADLESG